MLEIGRVPFDAFANKGQVFDYGRCFELAFNGSGWLRDESIKRSQEVFKLYKEGYRNLRRTGKGWTGEMKNINTEDLIELLETIVKTSDGREFRVMDVVQAFNEAEFDADEDIGSVG